MVARPPRRESLSREIEHARDSDDNGETTSTNIGKEENRARGTTMLTARTTTGEARRTNPSFPQLGARLIIFTNPSYTSRSSPRRCFFTKRVSRSPSVLDSSGRPSNCSHLRFLLRSSSVRSLRARNEKSLTRAEREGCIGDTPTRAFTEARGKLSIASRLRRASRSREESPKSFNLLPITIVDV